MSLVTVEYEPVGCQARYENTLHRWADKMRLTRFPLLRACIGEFFGTMVMIIFGVGVVAQGNFTENHSFFSISFGWGTAVIFGLFISGNMGYGLMNPAMSLAFAIVGKVPWIPIFPLMLCQVFGAYIGALVVYGIYEQNIKVLYNGVLNMESGVIFVTGPTVGNWPALMDQIIGTAILAALCLAFGDQNNFKVPAFLSPIYVGFLVLSLVGALGVNAGAALNPARDFGPRLALVTVGYGKEAFTHENYYFWIPIVGPFLGAIIGAIMYELTIGIHLRGVAEEQRLDAEKYDYDDE
ncbi:unnamed protein product [Echinostoma caproni]|uniref:Aquaporin-9 n=1 Tax=Echinostoma caproni TaxID=27848 RepID=A0A183A9X7_9TREM|nr:unnamed protein product [Echinostoma caproni]